VPRPKNYKGIMVSSTFTDLEEHRQAVLEAIEHFDHKPIAMEYSGARPDLDVLGSSLEMVGNATAYVGVISRKYGQVPHCPARNPEKLSITELEFNEAQRLGRPIVLFIMEEGHPLTESAIELDPEKREKLGRFRERAKRMAPDAAVERVYETFDSLEGFKVASTRAIGKLAAHLEKGGRARARGSRRSRRETAPSRSKMKPDDRTPRPPMLAAFPRYLASHTFVGRAAEMQRLDDWSAAADPTPMLLFEAIGGSGKSMLTWEWVTKKARLCRADWAGRFWFSFYEKGAVMSTFCKAALAYMLAKPVERFERFTNEELTERFFAELQAKPWLLVLDGLERVLVAYHRYDAAQAADEDADFATDRIAHRNPCAAIRPEDDQLLRRLASATPSKILISTRITPSAVINPSGIPMPGVKREILGGLRPTDAEAMVRGCGVFGSSREIQDYLQTNCDCHPLVIGALAGLINDYLPDRGNFDEWAKHPQYGAALNLGRLELVQRRNHIILSAIEALSPASRRLLQTLSLLQGGADYDMIKALNPHAPPRPVEPAKPVDPATQPGWALRGTEHQQQAQRAYQDRLNSYQQAETLRRQWKKAVSAPDQVKALDETVRDLERRGLVQYDRTGRSYDLHPVVRGVVSGRMEREETAEIGQQVVDYFNSVPHSPWADAESLVDLEPGLEVVRVLLRMGKFSEAFDAYGGDLADALLHNVDAASERQALLAPFFPDGWENDPVNLPPTYRSYVKNAAALVLIKEDPATALNILDQTAADAIRRSDDKNLVVSIRNMCSVLFEMNRLAEWERLVRLSYVFAQETNNRELAFTTTVILFSCLTHLGMYEEAERLWPSLEQAGRNWSRTVYLPGDAETLRAANLFAQGRLDKSAIDHAMEVAHAGRNRSAVIELCAFRGEFHLAHGDAREGRDSLKQAVEMSRMHGSLDVGLEADWIRAALLAGDPIDARSEAERLLEPKPDDALSIAKLWEAIGDYDRSLQFAREAAAWSIADGIPYVHFWALEEVSMLFRRLNETPPKAERYEGSIERRPWEAAFERHLELFRKS